MHGQTEIELDSAPAAHGNSPKTKKPGGQTGRRAIGKIQARKKIRGLFDQYLPEFSRLIDLYSIGFFQ
jgi:hypothetical protein